MTDAVTVVIPVFNGARFLGRTIASLLAQQYERFEVICVDDLSTDDSLGVAKSFEGDSRFRVVQNDMRRGLAGNWNRAFELATTPLLVIAHQDDLYEPRFLAATSRLLAHHPRAFIAHARATYLDEHDRPIDSSASRYKDRFWPDDEPYEREPAAELRVLQNGNYIICPAAMYRMSAVAQIGAFNESYRFVPDWEYWFRGLLAGFTIAGTHERLVGWRRHDETATKQEETSLRRYDEELELLTWLAREAGLPRRVDLIENTILSDYATRLARGDRAGAHALHRYVRERLPESRRNLALMRFGAIGGPVLGRALKFAEAVYTRFAMKI